MTRFCSYCHRVCCLTQIHSNTFSTNDSHSLTSGPERERNRERDTKSYSNVPERDISHMKCCIFCCQSLVVFFKIYSVSSVLNKKPELFTGLLQSSTDPHVIINKHKMMKASSYCSDFFPPIYYRYCSPSPCCSHQPSLQDTVKKLFTCISHIQNFSLTLTVVETALLTPHHVKI